MEVALKKRWVDALRGGEYTQGFGGLKMVDEDGVTHCCLGVLGEILRVPDAALRGRGFLDDNDVLPMDVQSKLAEMNDSGDTFGAIADWIERTI